MLISQKQSSVLKQSIKDNKDSYCKGLYLSAKWFVLSQIAKTGTHLIILPDKEQAEYCSSDLYGIIEKDSVFFLPDSGKKVERSNYKSSLVVQRTSAIDRILSNDSKDLLLVVTYPEAIEEKIPSKNSINKLTIKVEDEISHSDIKAFLSGIFYERVDYVAAPGQYAIRGSIVDVFSFSNNYPYRISFFGNEVEKISVFDINTQLSVSQLDKIDIIQELESCDNESDIYITNLLSDKTVLWLDSSDLYKEKEFFQSTNRFKKVYFDTPISLSDSSNVIRFDITPQPVFNKNFELLTEDIRKKIEGNYKVFIFGEKESQLDRLKNILSQNGGIIPEFIPSKNIHNGFIDNEDRICCYSDHEIFDRFHRVIIRRTVEKSEQLTINDLASFNIGDYVVHIDHGVGVFGGLVRMFDEKNRVKEVVKLMYKDGDVVFVSVHALHKISLYKSKDSIPPKINKLGSKTWQNLKSSAKKKIKDIAADLIKIYAKRKSEKGYSYSSDSYLQEELESSFIYEDTPDQISATQAIKRDMEDNSPMDRLVCGDVGFGKTEIAVRAAFKAVCDNKQVAVLVPTTILSLQHYKTFSSRLSAFPCNIEYVSRLRSTKEITDIKKRLLSGRIDIIIGTHKILSKDFEFKDLGLLIIDEEQKFGVSAKERLRQIKSSVDTLTLTATPIPRTLQFSLLGARDLSIISTPPQNRIPVQTEIILFDEANIKSIINYELNRGGQVFFLHNRVEELPAIADILHRLVPDMKICIAHGQMESKELENKMLDFIQGDYDLLLCTTIIENGLDIPNANTIIVNHANMFGLSDLHQLRGRVGRSNKKAFCYLIVPPLTTLTTESRRRLKAIEEYSDLGSGFNIAMQDLDIRGAGNLLGAEQSGYISDMGYETYQKILSEAMEELGMETGISTKVSHNSFITDCTIETDFIALIPDSYIDVTSEKVRIYKELDSLNNEKLLNDYAAKLQDRFGTMPEELVNLFDVVKIRCIGEKLGFEKIIIKNNVAISFFIHNPMSQYYKSDTFMDILNKAGQYQSLFEFKQTDGKLRLISRNIDSLKKARVVLSKLCNNG